MAVNSDRAQGATEGATAAHLGRRSLGVADIVFFVVAASAPLTVVAGGVPTSFAVTSLLGIPLVYVIIAVILLVFAVGYAAMSRHVANSGAFYTYVSKGLGQAWGVSTALVALVAYNAMQVGIFGLYGFAASAALEQFLGLHVAWWISALVTVAIIAILGQLQVDLNARVLALFLILESLVVLVFDIAGIAKPAEGLTIEPFLPAALSPGALGAALCFVTASFVGFESAAIYGEECKNPQRTVARATYTAVIIIGVFYAASAWATVMAVGKTQIIGRSQELTAGLLFVYAEQNVGKWFADIATVLFVTSLFAALLSFHNSVARYFFSLGREGVLPSRARPGERQGRPDGRLARTDRYRRGADRGLRDPRQGPRAQPVRLADQRRRPRRHLPDGADLGGGVRLPASTQRCHRGDALPRGRRRGLLDRALRGVRAGAHQLRRSPSARRRTTRCAGSCPG